MSVTGHQPEADDLHVASAEDEGVAAQPWWRADEQHDTGWHRTHTRRYGTLQDVTGRHRTHIGRHGSKEDMQDNTGRYGATCIGEKPFWKTSDPLQSAREPSKTNLAETCCFQDSPQQN